MMMAILGDLGKPAKHGLFNRKNGGTLAVHRPAIDRPSRPKSARPPNTCGEGHLWFEMADIRRVTWESAVHGSSTLRGPNWRTRRHPGTRNRAFCCLLCLTVCLLGANTTTSTTDRYPRITDGATRQSPDAFPLRHRDSAGFAGRTGALTTAPGPEGRDYRDCGPFLAVSVRVCPFPTGPGFSWPIAHPEARFQC